MSDKKDITALAQATSSRLLALVQQLAWYYRVNDCEERDTAEAIEIPISDLRIADEIARQAGLADGPASLNQSAPPSPAPLVDGEPLVTARGGADTNNATPWNNSPRQIQKRAMQARTAALAAQAPAAPVETPPEVMERRRKGLSDYEKPPLGQPPSWLQEQEKIAEPVQCSSAGTAEAIRTATLWFEQQIENAQQDQISGFRSGPQVRGERALARHFALYEAQQVFLEATRTFSGPQTLSTPEGGK